MKSFENLGTEKRYVNCCVNKWDFPYKKEKSPASKATQFLCFQAPKERVLLCSYKKGHSESQCKEVYLLAALSRFLRMSLQVKLAETMASKPKTSQRCLHMLG